MCDLLDEDVIKERFPNHPGHAEAQEVWKKALIAGWKGGRKKF